MSNGPRFVIVDPTLDYMLSHARSWPDAAHLRNLIDDYRATPAGSQARRNAIDAFDRSLAHLRQEKERKEREAREAEEREHRAIFGNPNASHRATASPEMVDTFGRMGITLQAPRRRY